MPKQRGKLSRDRTLQKLAKEVRVAAGIMHQHQLGAVQSHVAVALQPAELSMGHHPSNWHSWTPLLGAESLVGINVLPPAICCQL